ncbi:MAG: DUF2892 domain-containing protein [Campylobacterales bacterium]|nr:DUF2892 domain-containing protein [Campylobacterales bacterium]
MTINAIKMRKFCSPFRIVLGLVLILGAIVTGWKILYIGVVPLVAGLTNFCPACYFTSQCDLFGKDLKDEKKESKE